MLAKYTNQTLRAAKLIKFIDGISIQGSTADQATPDAYYKFRLTKHSRLNVSPLDTNIGVTLLQRQGQITKRLGGDRQQSLFNQTLKPGTYFIHVQRDRGNTRYRLKLTLTEPVASRPKRINAEDTWVGKVVQLTNDHRKRAGLKPLRLDPLLSEAAQAHSEDMAYNDFFSHTGSNGSSVFDRITETGYSYATAAENIAAGYPSPEKVVSAWMHSPGHRANILNPALREVGIGFVHLRIDPGQAIYQYYWTQDFGTPMT
jgi:uncharacterized protein YkwD